MKDIYLKSIKYLFAEKPNYYESYYKEHRDERMRYFNNYYIENSERIKTQTLKRKHCEICNKEYVNSNHFKTQKHLKNILI